MSYLATTLTYVRTSDGVMQVGEGEGVPTDALPHDLERLIAAGALTQEDTGGEDTGGEQPSTGEPPPSAAQQPVPRPRTKKPRAKATSDATGESA